jgi:hypothetical protein
MYVDKVGTTVGKAPEQKDLPHVSVLGYPARELNLASTLSRM